MASRRSKEAAYLLFGGQSGCCGSVYLDFGSAGRSFTDGQKGYL